MSYSRFFNYLSQESSLSDRALCLATEEVRLFLKGALIFSAPVSIQIPGPKLSSTNRCRWGSGRQVVNSPTSGAEIKNIWGYFSTP